MVRGDGLCRAASHFYFRPAERTLGAFPETVKTTTSEQQTTIAQLITIHTETSKYRSPEFRPEFISRCPFVPRGNQSVFCTTIYRLIVKTAYIFFFILTNQQSGY